jgi:cell division protein FtsI/penicillin-binding protein 2
VISKSCNVCTIKLAQRLGPKLLHEYVKKFGFGSKTGIELPGEASGLVRDVGDWSGVSASSISIGYEVSVTPIQLITAYAAIANGGVLVPPRLVKAMLRDRRGYNALTSRRPRRVVSEKTAATVTSILKEVVESGTGKEAAIDGYAVAGKTGTARKYDPGIGAYSSSKYIASFVGYLPADKPRVAILVVIDEPKSSIYGGSVAAPVFSRIGSQVVRYLKIPGDGSLLRVAAPEKVNRKGGISKKAENLSLVKRMNRGFLELLDRARSSIMKPFEKKKSDQKIDVKI